MLMLSCGAKITLKLHCESIHNGCLLSVQAFRCQPLSQVSPAHYLHPPKQGVGKGYSVPTTLSSPTSAEERSVGGSLAVAGSKPGPAPAYATIPNNLSLVRTYANS